MPEAHDPYAALRHRDYRCLLGGTVLASIGNEAVAYVVGWELYERTDDALALGLAGLAQFLPVLLLSLPAGHAADRVSRKRLLQGAHGLMGLASGGLALLSFFQGPLPLYYLCLLVSGCGRAFSAPPRWALVPQVVPPEALPNAVTWNSSGWQLAFMAGPGLGGLLAAVFHDYSVVYLLGFLTAVSCVTLLSPIQPRSDTGGAGARSLGSLLVGLRFVFQNKVLLAALTLDLFAVLLGGVAALLPIFAQDILQVGPAVGGVLAAPGIGALLMAFVLAHRPPLRRPGWALVIAVAGFGAATIGFGLSRNVYLSFAMLALTGALDNISVVVRGTLVQILTPDAMRGRVAAVNLVFISSSNELGAFESGVTAKLFGPVLSAVGGGIGTIVVVLTVMASWPQLLKLGVLGAVAPKLDAEQTTPTEERDSPRLP